MGDLIFPPICVGCRQVGSDLCPSCFPFAEPTLTELYGCPLLSLGGYHGSLAQAIVSVKRRGHKTLGRELAQRLALSVRQRWGGESVSAVFAVPQSSQGGRYRGFSLPEMMEEAVCKETGWTPLSSELRCLFPRTRETSRGLTAEQRRERLELVLTESLAVLAAHPSKRFGAETGGTLLVLDDVVTTGTTLFAQLRLAERSGWSRVLCAAIASNYRELEVPGEYSPHDTERR